MTMFGRRFTREAITCGRCQQKTNTEHPKTEQATRTTMSTKHFFLYLTVLLVQQTSANDGTTCAWTDPEGKTIDLSAMTKGPPYYEHEEGNFIFRLNLCGEVDSSTCSNHDAAAVQYTKDDDKCVSVLAAASKPPSSWSKLQPPHDGFALTFTGGDAGCSEAPFTRSMTYDMVCDNTLTEAELLSVVENPTCVYTAIWKINCTMTAIGMSFQVKCCLLLGFLFCCYLGIAVYLERQDTGENNIPESHKEYWREFGVLAHEGLLLSYEKAKEVINTYRGLENTDRPAKNGYDAVPSVEKGTTSSYGSGVGGDLDGEREPDFGDDNL